MEDLRELFHRVRVYGSTGVLALHKPLLLLFALGRCLNEKPRMTPFSVVDLKLKLLFSRFYRDGLAKGNTHYPFGRLENDGLWEIEKSSELKRTSVGHLIKPELIERNIHGGFSAPIYNALRADKQLILKISQDILDQYFESSIQQDLRVAVGLPADSEKYGADMENSISNLKDAVGEYEHILDCKNKDCNDFIDYLNSLHNVTAGGANALAESQAMSRYFGELYEPFGVTETIFDLMGDYRDCVVILTGHAGDGKSTVALDVLKRLRGIPLREPLDQPLKALESVDHPTKPGRVVSVVKDMSELSAEQRLQWLNDAFKSNGSWLIISNTGPLLNTLGEYAKNAPGDIESRILGLLNKPYSSGNLGPHTLTEFPKDVVILNMTRLDNVALGAKLLARMVDHSGWRRCDACDVSMACPLRLNRRALQETGPVIEARVRWIYQRLTAYEQRLTLRQMVAHLAFSLTGGMTCHEARTSVNGSTAEGVDRGTEGLEEILFSEGFFGYRKGKPLPKSDRLRAIELMRRQRFGAPVAVDFERQLPSIEGPDWVTHSDALAAVAQRWRERAGEAAGSRWRFAQRRMLYLFGQPISGAASQLDTYLDHFLQSPRLRDFDQWRHAEAIEISPVERKRLCKNCLRVLLEIYSGFSAGQFRADQEYLYLTLRRPDRAVVQPTQLVVAELPFSDFDLDYDPLARVPLLRFQNGKVSLLLSLPLLDFIHRRHEGQLGSDLSQIHLAQLEWFRAELLRMTDKKIGRNDVVFLRAGIDGQTHLHRYVLDEENQRLELET
ncbi:hypothetical protein G3480_13230 [Thiorhodococcus mannitoliphagus]|uniref:ScoMcrA-like DNA sulfur-binding domain-containing protein n=1 Tax=Thiorhodococcus mannitoliphagus TaxID=329406 RepID=A0A6P1E0G9_9GAMM|nr:hypothetical protein [Thiorhodococcus mannitoliphagus]NEX21265.1 hypothetical protein [Thiorhodococcus mannitoliphagus]